MGELEISKIEKVLDERVRPNLAQHGGDIEIEKLEDGVLHVRMHGQCSGCPSAELTLENLVNTELKEAFPELKDVVLVTGVSDRTGKTDHAPEKRSKKIEIFCRQIA